MNIMPFSEMGPTPDDRRRQLHQNVVSVIEERASGRAVQTVVWVWSLLHGHWGVQEQVVDDDGNFCGDVTTCCEVDSILKAMLKAREIQQNHSGSRISVQGQYYEDERAAIRDAAKRAGIQLEPHHYERGMLR